MIDKSTIMKVITHQRPHFDEAVAIWLVMKFLTPVLIEFVANGNKEIPVPEGAILIGVGGGKLDEHTPTGNRKVGECSATLVAKWLGVENNPALKKLLEYTLQEDERVLGSKIKVGDRMSVAIRMKSMFNYMTELEVMNWAMVAIDDLYLNQSDANFQNMEISGDLMSVKNRMKSMLNHMTEKEVVDWASVAIKDEEKDQKRFENAVDEFESNAKIVEILVSGKPMQFASITSPNKMADVSRKKGVAVLVQKNEYGTQVFFDLRSGLDISDFVRVLRSEENLLKGIKSSDWKLLQTSERIDASREWYFRGGFILNGSETATDVPKTKITLDRILELAILTYGSDADWRKCQPKNVSVCNACPYSVRHLGMSACRKFRTGAKGSEKRQVAYV